MTQPVAVGGEARALASLVAEFRQAVLPAIAEISPTFRAAMVATGIIVAGSKELPSANQNNAVAINNAIPNQLKSFLSRCAERGVVDVPYDFLVACAENPNKILQNNLYSRLVGKFEAGEPVPNENIIMVMNRILAGDAVPQITSQAEMNRVRAAQMGLLDRLEELGVFKLPESSGNSAAPDPEDPMFKRWMDQKKRQNDAFDEEARLTEISEQNDKLLEDIESEVTALDEKLKQVEEEVKMVSGRVDKMSGDLVDARSRISSEVRRSGDGNASWKKIDAEKNLETSLDKCCENGYKAGREIAKINESKELTNARGDYNIAIADRNIAQRALDAAIGKQRDVLQKASDSTNKLQEACDHFTTVNENPTISSFAKQKAKENLSMIREDTMNIIEDEIKALTDWSKATDKLIDTQKYMLETGQARIKRTKESINAHMKLIEAKKGEIEAMEEWFRAYKNILSGK